MQANIAGRSLLGSDNILLIHNVQAKCPGAFS